MLSILVIVKDNRYPFWSTPSFGQTTLEYFHPCNEQEFLNLKEDIIFFFVIVFELNTYFNQAYWYYKCSNIHSFIVYFAFSLNTTYIHSLMYGEVTSGNHPAYNWGHLVFHHMLIKDSATCMRLSQFDNYFFYKYSNSFLLKLGKLDWV